MNPVVTVPNETMVVSLDEMKKQLHYEHTIDEDYHIESLTMAMQLQAEAATNRRLLTTTQQYKIKEWKEWIKLPYSSPLQSITSIQYYDADNNLQTLAASNYEIYSHLEPAKIRILSEPTHYDRLDAIVITYVAGWSDVADVPEDIKLWLKIKVSELFMIRTGMIVGASVSQAYDPDMYLMNQRVLEF